MFSYNTLYKVLQRWLRSVERVPVDRNTREALRDNQELEKRRQAETTMNSTTWIAKIISFVHTHRRQAVVGVKYDDDDDDYDCLLLVKCMHSITIFCFVFFAE